MEKPSANSPSHYTPKPQSLQPFPDKWKQSLEQTWNQLCPSICMRWAHLQLAAKLWWRQSDGWHTPMGTLWLLWVPPLSPDTCPGDSSARESMRLQSWEIWVWLNVEVGEGARDISLQLKACTALPEEPSSDPMSGDSQPVVTPAPDYLAPSFGSCECLCSYVFPETYTIYI